MGEVSGNISRSLAFLLVLLLFSMGCRYSPWESVEYVPRNAGNDGQKSAITNGGSVVGGAVIAPYFESSDPGLRSGEAPFILRVSAFGKEGVHDALRIEEVRLLSAADEEMQQVLSDGSDPVLAFNQDSTDAAGVWASTDLGSKVRVMNATNTTLTVEMAVQVRSNSTWISDTVSCAFVVHRRRGRFDWITQ